MSLPDPSPITIACAAELSTHEQTPIFSEEQIAKICVEKANVDDNDEEVNEVLSALREGRRADLKRLAASGPHGLICRKYREKAWPLILGITPSDDKELSNKALEEGIKSDWADIIIMDVNRSFYTITDPVDIFTARAHLAAVLFKFAGCSIINTRNYRYFQGLHDIAAVIMIATNNEDVTVSILLELACTKLEPLFTNTLAPMLERPFAIVAQADQRLSEFMKRGDASTLFLHRWLTTWFAHDLDDQPTIQRIFDLLITSDFTQGFYLAAALMCLSGDTLMRNIPCDMASIHKFFCERVEKITSDDNNDSINVFALVNKSVELRSMFPIDFTMNPRPSPKKEKRDDEKIVKKPSKRALWIAAAVATILVFSFIHYKRNNE